MNHVLSHLRNPAPIDQVKILHQVWVQGESNLPDEYRRNRELWRRLLPRAWEMRLWDEEAASKQWPDWDTISPRCAHHATRADIILARAQRDFGGMATGTDVLPLNIAGLLDWCKLNGTLVIYNPAEGLSSNGLSYVERPNHDFWVSLCKYQLRDGGKHLSNPRVWQATGPKAWADVLRRRIWNLSMATDVRAYGRYVKTNGTAALGEMGYTGRAFVDPGYAGTWRADKPKR